MKCDEFENRIQQLLDHRLPLADDKPIARHAVACRRCHRTLQAYQDLSLGLDAWDPPALDAGFAQRVVAIAGAAPALPAARRSPQVRWAWAAVAAALLLALWPTLRGWLTPVSPSPAEPERVPVAKNPQQQQPSPEPASLAVALPQLSSFPADLLSVAPKMVAEPFSPAWQEWATNLARRPLQPMDGLADGLRPITTTLTVAIDVLRNTIPVGRESRAKEESPDSAKVRSAQSPGAAV
jgi:hypothetical protein